MEVSNISFQGSLPTVYGIHRKIYLCPYVNQAFLGPVYVNTIISKQLPEEICHVEYPEVYLTLLW
jgi:hypothetical protein